MVARAKKKDGGIQKKGYKINPLCLTLPPMSDPEIDELAKDIEQNGQKVPVQLDAEGQILDGRNRYLAHAKAITVKPLLVRKWTGKADRDSYAQYIIQHNVMRRQHPMNAAQRASFVAALRVARLPERGGSRSDKECPPSNGNDCRLMNDESTPISVEQLAREANVSDRTMRKAIRVQREKPEAVADILANAITLDEALAEPEQPAEPPKDEFGNDLTPATADAFVRSGELDDIKRQIDAIRREIEGMCKAQDPLAAHIHYQSVEAALKTAAAGLRLAAPYCICPYCLGEPKSCDNCHKSGWMPKALYEQVVRPELKWKAEKK